MANIDRQTDRLERFFENGFLKPGGALDQGLISCFQNASQTLISSRPNPTKKLEENPVPLPEE